MPLDGELTPSDDTLRADLEASFGDVSPETGGGDVVSGDIASSGDRRGIDAGTVAGPAIQPEAKFSADGRERGPDGKFIEKPAAPDEKVAAAKETPSTDAAKASTDPASTPAVAPPAGWTAAEKAEWQKLPPVVQAAVSRREAEMSRGGLQWSEEKRRYEAVLSPVAEAARRNGLTTEDGLKSLLQAQSFLERDAPAAIKWLAQSHNVNLATLAGSPDDVPSAQTPDIEALVRQAVQRSVAPIVAPIQQRWQQEEQSRQDMTTRAIESFATSPGHEHYAAVEGTIALILPQVIEENPAWSNEQKLQEAYDRALYATPATRKQVLEEQERKAEETRRSEAAQRATKARGAAVSITGSPSGSSGPDAAGSLREEIVRAMTG